MYTNFFKITQIKVKYLKTQKINVKQDKIKKRKKICILVVLFKKYMYTGKATTKAKQFAAVRQLQIF